MTVSLLMAVPLHAATLYWNDNSPESGLWSGSNWATTEDGEADASFTSGSDSIIINRTTGATISLASISSTITLLGLEVSPGTDATITTGGSGNQTLTISGAVTGDLVWQSVTAGKTWLQLTATTAWDGTLTAASTNSRSGTASGTGSRIDIQSAAAVGVSTRIALNGTDALTLNQGTGGSNVTIGELSGTNAGALITSINQNSTRHLTVDQATNTTYAGGISPDTRQFTFEKSGSGRLRLTGNLGNSSQTGTLSLAVSQGSLYINGTGNALGDITVSSGATLGGLGTIGLTGTTAVTVADGGILDPGDISDAGAVSTGTLTIGGDSTGAGLVFSGSATIDFSLGATPSSTDAIVLTGSTMTGSAAGGAGSITFNFIGTGGSLVGRTFDLISFGGTTPGIVLSAFALSSDSIAAGWAGTFSYGGDGNLLQFTVTAAPIPEPRTLALLAGAGCLFAAALLRARRSARRQA